MEHKLVKLLKRLRNGDCPRCSHKDFDALNKEIPGVMQLESAHGADTSGGYVLTSLRTKKETDAAIDCWFAKQVPNA